MKRIILCLCILSLTLFTAWAEVKIPSYDSYAKLSGEGVSLSENYETATLQCYTDAETVEAYQKLIGNAGFLINGSWKLGAGEGYTELEITSYRYMGKEQPKAFAMTVQETSFSCHILLQVVYMTSGEVFFSMTRSQEITSYDYDPVEFAEICTHCNQGKCRECNGTGQKPCGICNGTRICPTCGGIRRWYITGYGTGSGTYVYCEGCHGDGKCWGCNGSGTEECLNCENGVCSFCHGNWLKS